jgi:RNA polymerase sigma factor (sigma-70 family)
MPILYFGRKRKAERLATRTVSGAEARRVFEQHYTELFEKGVRFATRCVDDDGEEVTQQALADLWTSCFEDGEIDPNGVHELFAQILRRRIADRLRELRREALRDENYIESISERLERREDITLLAEDNELPTRLAMAIAALPESTKRVYTAVSANDGDVRAALEELSMTYNTARWHMTRATERIRKALEKDGYGVPATLSVGRRATGEGREP